VCFYTRGKEKNTGHHPGVQNPKRDRQNGSRKIIPSPKNNPEHETIFQPMEHRQKAGKDKNEKDKLWLRVVDEWNM
jgi:hypothetical protein